MTPTRAPNHHPTLPTMVDEMRTTRRSMMRDAFLDTYG
jgi:hypothetical protein